jgi:hypothetical protein
VAENGAIKQKTGRVLMLGGTALISMLAGVG